MVPSHPPDPALSAERPASGTGSTAAGRLEDGDVQQRGIVGATLRERVSIREACFLLSNCAQFDHSAVVNDGPKRHAVTVLSDAQTAWALQT